MRQSQHIEDPELEARLRAEAAAAGQPFYLYSGTIAPFQVNLVQETTRFHQFGPLSGSTFSLGFEVAPGFGSMLSRQTAEVDARKYFRVGSTTTVFATRVRGYSRGAIRQTSSTSA